MSHTPTDGSKTVRFKKLDDRALVPDFATDGAAGFDLAVLDDVYVAAGQTVMARTGLVIATPAGHMTMVAPRSSTWKKWGVRLANTIGIVDEDYCGDEDEMFLALWNPSGQPPTKIPAGTRIAQGIFVPVLSAGAWNYVRFEQQDMMGQSRGGWGSTGS